MQSEPFSVEELLQSEYRAHCAACKKVGIPPEPWESYRDEFQKDKHPEEFRGKHTTPPESRYAYTVYVSPRNSNW